MSFELHASSLVKSARQALEIAISIPEIKNARGLAKAARACAYGVNAPQKTLFCAACLWIRAEYKLGKTLASTTLANAAEGNQYSPKNISHRLHAATGPLRLADLGVSKWESHRAQQLAVLTEEELDQWLRQQRAVGIEPTLTAARELAKRKASRMNGRPIKSDR